MQKYSRKFWKDTEMDIIGGFLYGWEIELADTLISLPAQRFYDLMGARS